MSNPSPPCALSFSLSSSSSLVAPSYSLQSHARAHSQAHTRTPPSLCALPSVCSVFTLLPLIAFLGVLWSLFGVHAPLPLTGGVAALGQAAAPFSMTGYPAAPTAAPLSSIFTPAATAPAASPFGFATSTATTSPFTSMFPSTCSVRQHRSLCPRRVPFMRAALRACCFLGHGVAIHLVSALCCAGAAPATTSNVFANPLAPKPLFPTTFASAAPGTAKRRWPFDLCRPCTSSPNSQPRTSPSGTRAPTVFPSHTFATATLTVTLVLPLSSLPTRLPLPRSPSPSTPRSSCITRPSCTPTPCHSSLCCRGAVGSGPQELLTGNCV
jgi:hypothetical protein